MSRSRSLIGFGVLTALTVAANAQPDNAAPPADPPPAEQPPPAPPAPPPAAADAPAVTAAAQAKTGKLRGRVLTSAGEPLIGGIVTVVGTPASAIVGGDGTFELEAPAGAGTIEVEATGFATKRSAIDVAAGRLSTIELRMA